MMQQVGRFDGKNYYLIKGEKEVKVSQLEYDIATTNDPLKRILLQILSRIERLERKEEGR